MELVTAKVAEWKFIRPMPDPLLFVAAIRRAYVSWSKK